MRVEFSEFALAGIRRALPDESRQQTCRAHLSFFLRRDHENHSFPCPAFIDKQLFVYFWGIGGQWRVVYEVDGTSVLIWSFSNRLEATNAI